MIRSCFRNVLIYRGHRRYPFGPYADHIPLQKKMFEMLNTYRNDRPQWKVSLVSGGEIVKTLSSFEPKSTLFVIPAGESSHLDEVFQDEEIEKIQEFVLQGGKMSLSCGSAYWASEERTFLGETKQSRLPLFQGRAIGPLFQTSKQGFPSKVVPIQAATNEENLSVFLHGGGIFDPLKTKPFQALQYYNLKKEETDKKIAALISGYGEGAVLMSMFHIYFGADDLESFRIRQKNWKRDISPTYFRCKTFAGMLESLEDVFLN